jgi:hypothetical protein
MLKERVKFDALFTTTKYWGYNGKHVRIYNMRQVKGENEPLL